MIRSSSNIEAFVRTFFLVVFSLFFLFPILWLILTSLKQEVQMFSNPPVWLFQPTLSHYRGVFQNTAFLRNLFNSLLIAGFSVFFCLLIGGMCAFGLVRYSFAGKSAFSAFALLVRMLPRFFLVIPIFLLARKINLFDTHLALIIAHTTFNLPLAIWLLQSFIRAIPVELEQSAKIDGCNSLQAFLKVTLPLCIPGFATTGIFCFIYSWNEFLFAFVLTAFKAKTMPVAILAFISPTAISWGYMFSAGVIVTFPIVVFGLVVQKHFVRGLTSGSLKN